MVKVFFAAFILFYSVASFGQKDSYKPWMVKEILKDSAFTGSIYSETISGLPRFYWPVDLQLVSQDNFVDGDHLFKTKEGLFTALEGTGRVYQIVPDQSSRSGLNFIRMDSTIHFGYNIGASVFFNQDTLYSLGGYGLWNFTWHLRYFRPTRRGWEVLPLNRQMTHINNPRFNFLDSEERQFYLVIEEFFNEGLKSSNTKIGEFRNSRDTMLIASLDLETKNWTTVGALNPEAKKAILNTSFIGRTPWGNLMSAGDRFGNYCYLINFRENRIYELKNKKFGSQIRDAAQSGEISSVPAERRLSYFWNDSIRYLNSNQEKFTFKLSLDDFNETPITIWTPLPDRSTPLKDLSNKIFLGLGSATLLAGLWLFYRAGKKQSGSNGDLFTKQELEVLQRFATSPEMVIKPDDLDQVLGTEGRTLEALKKRRSMLIRSINTKYSEHFDDDDDLIRTERLEMDRRMVHYVVDGKHHPKIQKILKSLS